MMAEIVRDGRDHDRELPDEVVRRGASQGHQQALDLLAGLVAKAREDPPPGRRTELLPPLGTL